MTGADAGVESHCGQISALGDVQLHVGGICLQLGGTNLRAEVQSRVIYLCLLRHGIQRPTVCHLALGHVKGLFYTQLQQFLQLTLVASNLCLSVHYIILCRGHL